MRLNARPIRILSTFVLIAVVNVYVFAAGVVAPNGKVLLGKLITMSNRTVFVNGAEAITGSIVLSGAQVTTPAASIATVQLDNVGAVTIAPNSNVTLTFDAKN